MADNVMRWRPIKSAPRDGTHILLAEPNPGGTEIPWLVIEARWIDCPMGLSSTGDAKPMWVAAYPAVYSDGFNRSWTTKPVIGVRATHWMPKPKPPAMPPRRARSSLAPQKAAPDGK